MKIYILLEDPSERIIRGVTLNAALANKIMELFPNLVLFIEEYETIEDETLKNLLEI